MIPAALAGQCTLGKLAEFPITMVDLRPLMTAKINGTDVRRRQAAPAPDRCRRRRHRTGEEPSTHHR